jgi:hypothetical protein
MSDHNVLSRHIKPAAPKLGIGWVNWQVLRRSYATWLVEAGADPKAVQAQMRHSRVNHHGYLCAIRAGSTTACGFADDGYGNRSPVKIITSERIG